MLPMLILTVHVMPWSVATANVLDASNTMFLAVLLFAFALFTEERRLPIGMDFVLSEASGSGPSGTPNRSRYTRPLLRYVWMPSMLVVFSGGGSNTGSPRIVLDRRVAYCGMWALMASMCTMLSGAALAFAKCFMVEVKSRSFRAWPDSVEASPARLLPQARSIVRI